MNDERTHQGSVAPRRRSPAGQPSSLVARMQNHAASLHNAGPRQLARLLAVDPVDPGTWKPEELGAILRHQMEARLSLDLELPRKSGAGQPASSRPAQGLSGQDPATFADLFHMPDPPVHLLRMVKDFAKANCCHPASALPNDIATLLYYASITAARLHAHDNISQLTDDALRVGIAWVLEQTWLDERTRRLFAETARTLPPQQGPTAVGPSD